MAEDLGTAYGGQQEDINDKLVLDLAWERQQKKVSRCNCKVPLKIPLPFRTWQRSRNEPEFVYKCRAFPADAAHGTPYQP